MSIGSGRFLLGRTWYSLMTKAWSPLHGICRPIWYQKHFSLHSPKSFVLNPQLTTSCPSHSSLTISFTQAGLVSGNAALLPVTITCGQDHRRGSNRALAGILGVPVASPPNLPSGSTLPVPRNAREPGLRPPPVENLSRGKNENSL